MGRRGVPVSLFVLDLLAFDSESTMALPFYERRTLLEGLELNGPARRTNHVFDDGEALFEGGLPEKIGGVVAKRLCQPYRPGERGWIKMKNKPYWRYPVEVAAARARAGL